MKSVRRRIFWGIATATVASVLLSPGMGDRLIDVIRSAYLIILLEAQAFAFMCS